MTKLYHGPEGQGWQVPGAQDRKAVRADVPNSPAELASWLNERRVPLDPSNLVPVQLAAESAADPEEPLGIRLAARIAGLDNPTGEATGNPNRCSKCRSILSATPEGAEAAAFSADLLQLANWIDVAPNWALERLVEIVKDKSAELLAREPGRMN